MAESTSSCVSNNRLSDDIDTRGSSKDLSEQVLHDMEPLIHVPFVVSLYRTSLKYMCMFILENNGKIMSIIRA